MLMAKKESRPPTGPDSFSFADPEIRTSIQKLKTEIIASYNSHIYPLSGLAKIYVFQYLYLLKNMRSSRS